MVSMATSKVYPQKFDFEITNFQENNFCVSKITEENLGGGLPRGWTRQTYRQGSAELGVSERPEKILYH